MAIGLFHTATSLSSRCGVTTATSSPPAACSRGRQDGDQHQTGTLPPEALASDAFERSVRRCARAAGERLRAIRPAALAVCAWFACCLFMLSAGLDARALFRHFLPRDARRIQPLREPKNTGMVLGATHVRSRGWGGEDMANWRPGSPWPEAALYEASFVRFFSS